ncbi:calcium-binding protein [Nonomuraea sp. JJY05]|uniref:calcium-binding protein n=1 Tax=Nonomuraea sp. JJY05 TaxID=3350255 RepID=UPI00373F6DBA
MSTRGNTGTVLRRHGVRALTAGAALAAALIAIAGPAHAATGVSVTGSALEITGDHVADDIVVFVDTDGSLIVRNTGDTVVPGAACVAVTANEVDCSSAGVTAVVAATGAGDDSFRNRTSLPSKVALGTGADRFVGGLGRDLASGDEGDDKLGGLAGNDVLVGGAGVDTADGGAGTDRCDAETELFCES